MYRIVQIEYVKTDFPIRLVGTGLRVHFKNPWHSNRLTGLFTETGLTVMLEGVEFDFVDVAFLSQVRLWVDVVPLSYLPTSHTCVHHIWTWSKISTDDTCPWSRP